MEEYTSQFLELRRFTPHQDERDIAIKYISKLSYYIRIYVVSLCCETVDRAIIAAMSVEAERAVQVRAFEGKQRREIADVVQKSFDFSFTSWVNFWAFIR